MTRAGFPHSEILGSRFVCQLPEAYRRLLRPSSAPGAKASTLCTYKLDHKRSFKDARVHCAVLKQPTVTTRNPAPTTRTPPTRTAHDQRFDRTRRSRPRQHPNGLFPQDPTACQADPRRTGNCPFPPHSKLQAYSEATDPTSRPVVDVPPVSTTPHTYGEGVGLDPEPTP